MIKVDIAGLNFQPADPCTVDYPRGALRGHLQLGSQPYHVEAYQVTVDADGVVSPVLSDYAEEVEALYTLCGGRLPTQELDGVDYVLAVFPFSD